MKKPERMSYPADRLLLCGEFRRGSRYYQHREQGTDDWLLIYTKGGGGRLTSPHSSGTTRVGEAILYTPGEFHDYGTAPERQRWHLLWVHFQPKPAWQTLLLWPPGHHGVRHLQLDDLEIRHRFVEALHRMIWLDRRTLPHAPDLAANALEEALLWAGNAAGDSWIRLDERIRKAMDYLGANLRAPFHMHTVALHCGLSISRLAHLFTRQVGISPQRFIERQRMQQAGQLLRRTGMTVAEIAAEMGYEDPFYFSNRFRKFTRQSPTAYRLSSRDQSSS